MPSSNEPLVNSEFIEFLMKAALHEAKSAASSDEVPVGAVIAHKGEIIARGANVTEQKQVVLEHAELRAIRMASERLGTWRLTGCILCVTLEPCTMCFGAIRLARIPVIAFGAGDSRHGAVGSLYDLSTDTRLGPAPRILRGVKRSDCEGILTSFFAKKR